MNLNLKTTQLISNTYLHMAQNKSQGKINPKLHVALWQGLEVNKVLLNSTSELIDSK